MKINDYVRFKDNHRLVGRVVKVTQFGFICFRSNLGIRHWAYKDELELVVQY